MDCEHQRPARHLHPRGEQFCHETVVTLLVDEREATVDSGALAAGSSADVRVRQRAGQHRAEAGVGLRRQFDESEHVGSVPLDQRDQRVGIGLTQPDVGMQHRQLRLGRRPGAVPVQRNLCGGGAHRYNRARRQPPPTERHGRENSARHRGEHEDMCQSTEDEHRLPTGVDMVRCDAHYRCQEQ